MQYIELTQGYVAAVDSADYERVSAHKWYASVRSRADGSVRVYAMRHVLREGGGRTAQMLHRFVTDTPMGMYIDHINGNGLDNRRANLRICTCSENLRNQRPKTGGSSAYKGVCWRKDRGKWVAGIKLNGEREHLGYFDSEQDAVKAYDRAALSAYGEYARTNGLGG